MRYPIIMIPQKRGKGGRREEATTIILDYASRPLDLCPLFGRLNGRLGMHALDLLGFWSSVLSSLSSNMAISSRSAVIRDNSGGTAAECLIASYISRSSGRPIQLRGPLALQCEVPSPPGLDVRIFKESDVSEMTF